MKRSYGILLPVFSLPSGHGIGDFGPASYRFADLLAENGVTYWQILPLNPGSPENGESPYFSGSSFAINPLLLSLEKLKDAGLLSEEEIAALPAFAADTIDYGMLRRAKMPLLKKAAARFGDNSDFDRFCEANRSWLDDFALFDVLRTSRAVAWPQWPPAFRDRHELALRNFAASRKSDVRIQEVLQFLAFTQWQDLRRHCADRNLLIVGDMPIYLALDSADAWSNPGLFKLDDKRRPIAVSGVPPDFFSATGQLWNNPVYDWNAHRETGFSWWIDRMRRLFSLYDVVRIDHFRGLVQYWEIPAGEETAVNGKWTDVPTYELFDTLIREINPFPVISEDLGIITDDVRAAMKKYGFPGMKVLQFAFGDDDPLNTYLPRNYEENCLVYTGTHDNLPTLGWLTTVAGDKEHARIAACTGRQSSDKETVWDLIGVAMESNAAIAVFPLQDILTMGKEARINDPGVLHGNWRWRWDPARDPAHSALGRLLSLGRKYNRLIEILT